MLRPWEYRKVCSVYTYSMDLHARTVCNVGARVYAGVIFIGKAQEEFLETPMGCAEHCGGAMINGLLANIGFSRCKEFHAEDDESVITTFGVLEKETQEMNFRIGVESLVGNQVLPCL